MIRRRTLIPTAIILTAGTLLLAVAPAAGQAVVQQVSVELVLDGAPPHPAILDRLAATVTSVADRLLVGREVDRLVPMQSLLDAAIREVMERVATGYAVSGTSLQVGVASAVTVRLHPVGALITELAVTVDLRAVHPKVQPLVDSLLRAGPVGDVQSLLQGLPLAALPWAGPLVEAEVRSRTEAALTGYTADVRIRPAETAGLILTVAPQDTRVIRDIGVRFRSSSIPTILLEQHAPQVVSLAEPLRGLPVAFASAHRRWLAQLLTTELAAYPPVQQYDVVATAGIDVAETSYVNVVADSLLYRVRAEAQLNVGTQAPAAAIVLHVGRLAAPGVEPFLQLRLIPSALTINWDLGLRIDVSPSGSVGGTYDFGLGQASLWTAAQLSRDLGVRGTWNVATRTLEAAITYRLNDFLAGELVGTSTGMAWLRLVSNL